MHLFFHCLEEMIAKRPRNISVLEMPEIYMIQIANTASMVNPKSYDSKRV